MKSDSPEKLDVNKKLAEAFKVSIGNLLESLDDEEPKTFDGVFYVEGDDEPLIVDPKNLTIGDLERLMEE